MQTVTCNFCGADDPSIVHAQLHDLQLKLPGEFRLVRCNHCGLHYLNPRPDEQELASYYPSNYRPFTKSIDNHHSALVRWARHYGMRVPCQSVTQLRRAGRLLDVGCATGVFLNEMRRYGDWELYGVEPMSYAASYARQQFGLDVHVGTLMEARYDSGFFDVVTLWDVLEHTDNPHAILKEIKRILRPGGWVVIKVPDPLCWEARTFGQYWAGYDAPRHLYDFPRPVLMNHLAHMGYDSIGATRLVGSYYTFTTSAGYWLRAIGHPHASRLVQQIAQSSIGRVLSSPLFTMLRMMQWGSSLTYFARSTVQVE